MARRAPFLPLETNRDEIRENYNENQIIKKGEQQKKQKVDELIIAVGHFEDLTAHMKHKLEAVIEEFAQMKQEIAELKQSNPNLYNPLFTNRELAIASIMKTSVEKSLNDCLENVLNGEAKLKNKTQRKKFLDRFSGCKGNYGKWKYKRLLRCVDNSSISLFGEILGRVEELYIAQLQEQQQQQEEKLHLTTDDVRQGMRKYFVIKKLRNVGAHVLDYEGDGELDVETKVAIIEDIQEATHRNWWRFKAFKDPQFLKLLQQVCISEKKKIKDIFT